MTPPREMSWQDAVMEIVQPASEPLHYTEITSLIGEQGLRTLTGANPAYTVRGALSALEKDGRVARTGRGLFAVPTIARRDDEQVKTAESEAVEAVQDAARLTVKAYGLYWSRDLVNWEPSPNSTSAQILGIAGGDPVNFADQDGIYLLHSANEIAYVGKTFTPSSTQSGLYNRLHDHNNHIRRAERWDTFSWFGFRPVDPESGQLMETPPTATSGDVINLIEAILIEGLMPRLNMRSGDDTKEWLKTCLYKQIEDRRLLANRLAALSEALR